MLDVELKIILAAANAEFFGLENSPYKKEFQQFDFEKLFYLAHHHGFIWQVFNYCQTHQLLNEREQSNAKSAVMFQTAQAMSAEQQLLLITKQFASKNIPYAVLKGAAIFPQFCSLQKQQSRYSADIDLLIEPENIGGAISVFNDMEYVCSNTGALSKVSKFIHDHSTLMRARDIGFSGKNKNDIDVDLHWRIAHPFSLPIETTVLLEKCETVLVNDENVQTLAFENHFLLLCIHGYLDKFFILKHLADIFWAMHHPRYDEVEILKHAKKFGVEKHIIDSCAAASFFFDEMAEGALNEQGLYVREMFERFEKHDSQPPRMHPGDKTWNIIDKLAYIQHQIKTRSNYVSWWSPLLMRLKYDFKMIKSWPIKCSVFVWWPIAMILKILKR